MNTRRIIGSAALVGIALAWGMPGKLPAGDKDDAVAVRALKFTPKEPTRLITLGGQSKVTIFTDTAAATRLLGKENAKPLLDMIDPQKEHLVLVSWTTSGPPDGMLKFEIKGKANERQVVFYVQGPAAKARGQRARIGADFFAVPRELRVSFDPKER